MKNSIGFLVFAVHFVLVGVAFAANNSVTKDEIFVSKFGLFEFVEKRGCKPSDILHKSIALQEGKKDSDQLFYCKNSCSISSGCSYHIFLAPISSGSDASKTNSLYQYAGSFFGTFEVLTTESLGHKDIRTTQSMGSDSKVEGTLKYDGQIYR